MSKRSEENSVKKNIFLAMQTRQLSVSSVENTTKLKT